MTLLFLRSQLILALCWLEVQGTPHLEPNKRGGLRFWADQQQNAFHLTRSDPPDDFMGSLGLSPVRPEGLFAFAAFRVVVDLAEGIVVGIFGGGVTFEAVTLKVGLVIEFGERFFQCGLECDR